MFHLRICDYENLSDCVCRIMECLLILVFKNITSLINQGFFPLSNLISTLVHNFKFCKPLKGLYYIWRRKLQKCGFLSTSINLINHLPYLHSCLPKPKLLYYKSYLIINYLHVQLISWHWPVNHLPTLWFMFMVVARKIEAYSTKILLLIYVLWAMFTSINS